MPALIDAVQRLLRDAVPLDQHWVGVPSSDIQHLQQALAAGAIAGLSQLFRPSNPSTSIAAAQSAVQFAHPTATKQVLELLADGLGRTDEEIFLTLDKQGIKASRSSLQHGRLNCVRSGRVRDSGERRRTTMKCKAIVWILS